MLLVVALQALEDLDRLIDGWFADLDLLEASGQRAVALEGRLVLGMRRRSDAAQLSGGDGRLQDVRSIHRPAADRACADDGVNLVDEKNCLFLFDERGDHRFEPLLELAAVLRS